MPRIRPEHCKISNGKISRAAVIQALRGKKVLFSLQLLAMLFLQLSVLLPVTAQAFASRSKAHGCFNDHRLCGCSPERIADHTCCCARSAGGCSMSTGHDVAETENNESIPPCHATSTHSFKAAPCGSASSLFTASVEDYVYLRCSPGGMAPEYSIFRLRERPERLISHFTDPMDPPPKFTRLA